MKENKDNTNIGILLDDDIYEYPENKSYIKKYKKINY